MSVGGIILCGGKSSRMGLPKAWLPFGPELMLQRVVRVLAQALQPIVVVAAPGQDLPELPPDVQIVRDERDASGPLEGLRAGLSALQGKCQRAYATSCDVPLLNADFVHRMIELAEAGDYDIAVPRAEGYHHPLAAVYRVDVLRHVEQLLAAGRLRPVYLFEQLRTRVVEAAELLNVDPELNTLKNLNHPPEYLAALAAAGFEARPETLANLRIE